jgi:hypothetical protein
LLRILYRDIDRQDRFSRASAIHAVGKLLWIVESWLTGQSGWLRYESRENGLGDSYASVRQRDMSIIEQVEEDLPNFPQDIIEQWMGYYAQSEGWPPADPPEGRWGDLLGNRGLSYWQGVEWHLETLSPEVIQLTPDCEDLIEQIKAAHAERAQNAYSEFMGEEARNRFHNIIWYLRNEGSLPCPPILLNHDGAYEILDGNHRVAAYQLWVNWKDQRPFQREPFPVPLMDEVEFWVGYPNV